MNVSQRLMLALMAGTVSVAAPFEATAQWEFDEPVKLPSPINAGDGVFDASPSVTADGLELYFISTRSDRNFRTWVATRDSTSEEFGPPAIAVGDNHAGVSDDGLSLVTNDDEPNDLFMWDRVDAASPWTNRTSLGSNVNSPDNDRWADISADGLELYFTRNSASDDTAPFEIWVATRDDELSEFGPATRLPDNINAGNAETPAISADGLHLFFAAADRPGGYGNSDLWVSTREDKSSPWGDPVNLGPSINTPDSEWSPDFAADGQTLYFARWDGADVFETTDIWRATVIPEPSTVLLLCIGVLGLLRSTRRYKPR